MGLSVMWFLRNLWVVRGWILILIAFTLPIPLVIEGSIESRCAYVMIAMAILWLTEALPIYVTALMPVFLLPMLGDTNMLFLGGLIVAVALEEVNLHKRIAIGITRLLGSRMNTLMLGLMLPTWFLSMWISNTAATSMMLPIIVAVTETMVQVETGQTVDTDSLDGDSNEKTFIPNNSENDHKVSSIEENIRIEDPNTDREREAELRRMSKGLALCVAYAANCGGIATLTGTPTNLVLQGQADEFFQDYGYEDAGITYANWLGFGVPLSILIVILAWLWLQLYFLRSRCLSKTDPVRKAAISKALMKEWEKLGPITFGEIIVLILFIILALLWVFRDLPNVGGWGEIFLLTGDTKKSSTARDSTASTLIAALLFVLPRELPRIFCWNKDNDELGREEEPTYKPILTWEVAEKKVAWGVIVLLGGGFALADACTASGLSKLVGCELRVFQDMEPWVMNLILCFIVAAATEITSNTATASLLMPIMFELAVTIGQHPLYLMISAATACSFAFMLPVATPPNAIVFSTGYIRIPDMAFPGIVMNIIGVGVLTLAINTWGSAIFGLGEIPSAFVKLTSGMECDVMASTAATLINSTIDVTVIPLTTTS